MKTELKHLRLDEVLPSKTNPRKDFTSAAAVSYLAELAQTITQHGVKQPALVRPDYCVGCRSHAQIEEKRRQIVSTVELIFGECRWRASKIAKCESLPCLVEEMTDDDAREVQQIENLQRRDLTPIEEAQGIEDMLSLKNDDGASRYTIDTLAQRLGHEPDWVYKRRELLKLPDVGKKALIDGTLSPKVARIITTVPGAARAEFAKRVVKPEFQEGPLTYAAAKELRDETYAKVLKGAPFSLDDADLVKEAGACTACPKMSANCAQLFDGDDNAHLKQRTCLDPVCYRAKIAALQKRQIAEAEKAGKKMLSAEEAGKIYPFYTATGEMDGRSPYAPIGRKPADHLLKKEVGKVGTWEKLVTDAEEKTGAKVPRVLIADQEGSVREHIEVKLAIAAIEKSGEPIFRDEGERQPKGADPVAVQRKAEAERSKVQWSVAKAALDALWQALLKGWDTAAVWDELFQIAKVHAGENGLGVIAKWRGLSIPDGDFGKADAVDKWAKTLKPDERDALIPVLLISAGVKISGAESGDFAALAKSLKVDVDGIAKHAVAEFKMKEKGARLKPAELEEKVRDMLRQKKSPAEIGSHLNLAKTKLLRIIGKIEKEEAAAKVTTDPKMLAEWVKAAAKGMSVEEIARSYKKPLADVKGALSSRDPIAKGKKAEKEKKKAGPVIDDTFAAKVRKLVNEGLDDVAIAKKLGISLPEVFRVRKEWAITRAGAPGAKKGGAAK